MGFLSIRHVKTRCLLLPLPEAGKAAGRAAAGSSVDDVGEHCYTRLAVQKGVGWPSLAWSTGSGMTVEYE